MRLRFINALLILFAFASISQAQEVFLFTTKYTNVVDKLAQLDTFLGYPNPPTKTDRALNWEVATNGQYAIFALDISPIYSPRTKSYHDIAEIVQNNLTVAQWGTNIVTRTNDLRVICRISRALAKQLFFLSLQDQ